MLTRMLKTEPTYNADWNVIRTSLESLKKLNVYLPSNPATPL